MRTVYLIFANRSAPGIAAYYYPADQCFYGRYYIGTPKTGITYKTLPLTKLVAENDEATKLTPYRA